MFTLKLLGGPSLAGPSGPLSGRVVQRRQMALLALLGGSRTGPFSRDKVVALLWPESPSKQARSSLSDTLHVLHKALGSDAIRQPGDGLELNPQMVWCDVPAFRSALREGRPEEALTLCQGPFLDGFHFPGAVEFGYWADGERDDLRREARRAADQLAAQAEAAGDLPGAAAWVRRALAMEPHDEVAARELMRLLASAGDRAAAVEAYEAFARGLRTDLELEPSAETVELARAIREGTLSILPAKPPGQGDPGPSLRSVPSLNEPDGPTAPRLPAASSPATEVPGISGEARPLRIPDSMPSSRGVNRGWKQTAAGALILGAMAVGAYGLLGYGGRAASPGLAQPEDGPSIAVLPFDNRSPDPTHEYFAGGLHDELLTQLAKVGDLKVISRTSVMEYATPAMPVGRIASELGVSFIVEGSIQVVGKRLRVTAQLIDAATDRHLWSERYDRTLDDAFTVQSDIARQVVAAVGATLTGVEARALTAAPTANPEAYLLYLQGLDYDRRPGRTQGDLEVALDLYERAVTLDSTFALAWAALSEAHGRIFWQAHDPSRQRLEWQRRAAETALRLSPDLPESHSAMGRFHYQAERDWLAALEEYEIALESLPNDARLWEQIGYAHRRLGNWDGVMEAFHKVVSLDPRNADAWRDLGALSLEQMRRYPEAVECASRALALAPDFAYADAHRGRIWARWTGQVDSFGAALDRHPPEADWGGAGGPGPWRALQLLWQRDPHSLLALADRNRPVFDNQIYFLPSSLNAAWAHQLLGDAPAAEEAFHSALTFLDSALAVIPYDWRVHASRGLSLAGLGLKDEARAEARWLEQSRIYKDDAAWGPHLWEDRARILAGIGDTDAALDEIERLVAEPSWISVHTLRLDPRWDPLREHPRFQELLKKHSVPAPG